MDRLLTDKEIGAVLNSCLKVGDALEGFQGLTIDCQPLLKAQDAKTRELTLKEVGEWLLTHNCRVYLEDDTLLTEYLQRGEMPEGKED